MELVANAHERHFVEWAKDKPEVLVLSADLTSSVEIRLFKQTYPDRFISMGLTEQHMTSFAAGLAREGYFPFLHTFAVFLYRRPLDQLTMSVAYSNLPVRLVGFLPGITTPGGASHQAIDDIGAVKLLPNMTILESGDATETEQIVGIAHEVDGPVYIRQLRGVTPRLFDPADRMVLGQARRVTAGTDITLLSSGISTEEAMRASQVLADRGVRIDHLHISTHKPFDDPVVAESIAQADRGVITMENHAITGGLGTAVAEVIAANGFDTTLRKIGLNETFAHGGSRPYLMRYYGLDAMALVREVEQVIDEPLGITEDELAAVRLEQVHSLAKAEAL